MPSITHIRAACCIAMLSQATCFESDPNGRVALSDFGIAVILGAVERDMRPQGASSRIRRVTWRRS